MSTADGVASSITPGQHVSPFLTVDSGSERADDATDILDCRNLQERLNGWTALHLAAIGGHLDVVYLLMEAGCDPQVKDKVRCCTRTSEFEYHRRFPKAAVLSAIYRSLGYMVTTQV